MLFPVGRHSPLTLVDASRLDVTLPPSFTTTCSTSEALMSPLERETNRPQTPAVYESGKGSGSWNHLCLSRRVVSQMAMKGNRVAYT